MKRLIPFSLLALALISGAAVAADKDKPTGSAATFEALDKDSDQRVSESEAGVDRTLSARFASLDADGDGYLTKGEFRARSKSEPRSTSEPATRPMPEPPTREPYR
jgi:Ca2+-binding EF-hand superfamily protein